MPKTWIQGKTDADAKNRQWCGCFVFYCFQTASQSTGIVLPLQGHNLWSGSRLIAWANQHDECIVGTGKDPAPGDIFSVKSGHIGLVSGSPDDKGSFETIEGNQGDLSTKWNGIAIRHLQRSQCAVIVRV